MKKNEKEIIQDAVESEQKKSLSVNQIEKISSDKRYLKKYLESSPKNNFQALLFELTHEKISEKASHNLWEKIQNHKKKIKFTVSKRCGYSSSNTGLFI